MAYKKYQNYDGNYIGDHRNQVGGYFVSGACKHLHAAAESKQQAGLHGPLGRKLSENYCRNGDKALAYDYYRTELVYGSKGHVSTAQTGQETRKDHTDIADPEYIDSQSITGLGMLSHCPQPQAEPCLIEHEPDNG